MMHFPASCPFAGQNMLMWMVQSVLILTNAEMQQQYVTEF